MARILSFPFRLTPGGAIAAVEQGGDTANAEQIAALALTRQGERPMVPAFGVPDPAFRGIDPSDLAAGIAAFGPPVTLEAVTTAPVDSATFATEVRFRA